MFNTGVDNPLIKKFVEELFSLYMPTVRVIVKQAVSVNAFDEPIGTMETLRQIKAFLRINPSQKLLNKFGILEATDILLVSLEPLDVGNEVDINGVLYEVTNISPGGWIGNSTEAVLYVCTGKRKQYV